MDALADALVAVAEQSRLSAVRTLASELDRLGQSRVTGLGVHGLVTQQGLTVVLSS